MMSMNLQIIIKLLVRKTIKYKKEKDQITLKKNKRKAVSMLFESDFNSLLKQSLLFSGILNKVDQMESRLVKQDEKNF